MTASASAYPADWFAAAQALTPVTAPQQIIAVASYPLPHGDAGANDCEPKQALDRMPATGAFIFGWENGGLSSRTGLRRRDFPSRPKHFKLTGFALYECLRASYMLRFRDAGRAFQIHIALGSRASLATRAIVLYILDSFNAKRI